MQSEKVKELIKKRCEKDKKERKRRLDGCLRVSATFDVSFVRHRQKTPRIAGFSIAHVAHINITLVVVFT